MKNLSKLFTLALAVVLMTSCVSKKKYDEAMAAAAAEKSALESELASSQEENARLQENSNKLQQNLNMSEGEIAKLSETVKENNAKISGLHDAIAEAFETYDENQVKVDYREGKLYITMANDILFRSGRSSMDKDSKDLVSTLADILKSNGDLDILVEGHTDSEPVKIHRQYRDNWGLSTARALSVVRALEDMGVDGNRLTATGKGDTQPIASNETKEGREQNRRTEFVIAPELDGLYKIYKDNAGGTSSGS
ncbi:MAG: OmpA family protein [Bacteroidota bacterium]